MNLSERITSQFNDLYPEHAISPEDYAFLDKDENMKNPVLIGLGGSFSYGTNIATSDVDIRGIAMDSRRNILLGNSFDQIVEKNTDTTIYSLKKAVYMFAACNPNMIEMLGLRPEQYLVVSPIGKQLLQNKEMFLSNKCINSFMGYASQQLYRLMQKTQSVMTEKEFCEYKVRGINNALQSMQETNNISGIYAVCKETEIDGKPAYSIDIHFDGNIGYPLTTITKIMAEVDKVEKSYNTSGMRNNKAIEHDKVGKHSMHLLRLYMMCEDLLLRGEIITYRKNEHDLLMDIRNEKYLGEDKRPTKEFFELVQDWESRIQNAKEHSVLPDKPDMERIEKFLMNANEQVLSEPRCLFASCPEPRRMPSRRLREDSKDSR